MRTVGNRTDSAWPCGAPRSQNNEFCWQREAIPAAPTPKPSRQVASLTPEQIERRREYQRNYIKTDVGIANRNAARQRERLIAKATRINKHNLLITHHTDADKTKTAMLVGKSVPNGLDR